MEEIKIKDTIYKSLKMIFTSEPLEPGQRISLKILLSNSIGQSYFASKVYQDKFNKVMPLFYLLNLE